MTEFHPFIHIERLDTEPCSGILNGTCYLSPKIDGTNATIYFDIDKDELVCGSRKRALSPDDDNAGFATWFFDTIDTPLSEAENIACLIADHPHIQVFGEWLGSRKFVGAIKDYNPAALCSLFIFDLYDMDKEIYLHPAKIQELCEDYNLTDYLIPQTKMTNPTMDDIYEFAQNNHYLIPNQDKKGEGVVVRNPSYRDKYGHYTVGKFVLDEYKHNKSKSRAKKEYDPGEVETAIIEEFVTDAELSKAIAKTVTYFDADEFHKYEGRMIGFFLNEIYNSCILDEIRNILKKFKNPIINFSVLRAMVQQKGRDYIGL